MANNLTIRTTVNINASAANAWRLLGEGFGDWATWAPGIEASTLQGPLAEGVLRINETPSLGTVTQKVVRFEPDEHTLAYDMQEGLPPFLSSLRNDWEIEALDDGRCRVIGVAQFGIADAAAPKKDQIEQQMTQTLEAFTRAIRTTLEGEGGEARTA